MEREIDIPELLELLKLAQEADLNEPLRGLRLYNPVTDEEYCPINIDGGLVYFEDASSRQRSVPISAISIWSAIIPSSSILNSSELNTQTKAARRKTLVLKFNWLGLHSGQSHSIEDLQIILDAWNAPLLKTEPTFRHQVYRAIKKLENEPGQIKASYQLGFKIMSRWMVLPLFSCPADYLIQLAYYRRWTKRTDEALEVSALIERENAYKLFSKYEVAVLATERAAAYMDKFEQTKTGLDQALRFLKYHHKMLDGRSDEHNVNAWKRYDALRGLR